MSCHRWRLGSCLSLEFGTSSRLGDPSGIPLKTIKIFYNKDYSINIIKFGRLKTDPTI